VKHNFKGSMLLAISLIQCSMGMHALDDAKKVSDIRKARIFVGNNTWISGHPDKIATFSKDIEDIRSREKGIPVGVLGGTALAVGISTFLSLWIGSIIVPSNKLSFPQILFCFFPAGPIIGFGTGALLNKYSATKQEQRYQEAMLQHVIKLDLKMHIGEDTEPSYKIN
jgi:hypothetical protein